MLKDKRWHFSSKSLNKFPLNEFPITLRGIYYLVYFHFQNNFPQNSVILTEPKHDKTNKMAYKNPPVLVNFPSDLIMYIGSKIFHLSEIISTFANQFAILLNSVFLK